MGHEVTIWTEKPEDAERLFNLVVDWMPSDEADNCTVSYHPESSWQPIETAPKDGTKIDLWFKWWRYGSDDFGFDRITDCYWVNEIRQWGTTYHPMPHNVRFTHWMPLPEPPERAP